MTRAVAALVLLLPLASGCADDQDPVAPPSEVVTDDVTDEVADVVTEVQQVAPALETSYRDQPYPTTVDEVVATLAGAGVTLAPGHEVGGYAYDPDAVEFVLCLQDADGAWASYDTAPMGVRDSGDSGGCP